MQIDFPDTTGRVEQSVLLLREATENSPNNAEAHWELGHAYRFGGMLPQAVTESELARRLDPQVKINSSAMNAYLISVSTTNSCRACP